MAKYIVTGATGVLGSYLVKELVNKGHHVNLLIRSKNHSHLVDRVGQISNFYNFTDNENSRIAAFNADIYKLQLGLTSSDVAKVFEGAEHMIHSAASLNLNQDKASALASARVSTNELINLCKKYGFNNSLRKLEVLSTVGVGGKSITNLKEELICSPREFHNNYELAKATAEEILQPEIENGLPITIHRPSMIVGDSMNGSIYSFQIFYFLLKFISGDMSLGLLPTIGDKRLDIINVDYVAKAIIAASTDPASIGKILHQCSGSNAPKVMDIANFYRDYRKTLGQKQYPIIPIPHSLFAALVKLISNVAPKKLQSKLKPVPHFLDYLKTHQEFGNQQSNAYFKNHELAPEDPIRLLKKIIPYYMNNL